MSNIFFLIYSHPLLPCCLPGTAIVPVEFAPPSISPASIAQDQYTSPFPNQSQRALLVVVT